LLGVVIALIQARVEGVKEMLILSDYENVVKRIEDFRMKGKGEGNSWYKWIYGIWKGLEEDGIKLEIEHVRAHVATGLATDKEKLNQRADDLAQKTREDCSLNRSPWPTFELPEYSPWLQADNSYIEQDLYSWTKSMRSSRRAKRISERYPFRFDLTCFETNDTNEDYYKRSTRDYSIKVQALTRGNALMTNMHAYRIFPDDDQWGSFRFGGAWWRGLRFAHHVHIRQVFLSSATSTQT
jgi:hypothetical protein